MDQLYRSFLWFTAINSPWKKLYEKDFSILFNWNYCGIHFHILHLDEEGLPGKKALSFKQWHLSLDAVYGQEKSRCCGISYFLEKNIFNPRPNRINPVIFCCQFQIAVFFCKMFLKAPTVQATTIKVAVPCTSNQIPRKAICSFK